MINLKEELTIFNFEKKGSIDFNADRTLPEFKLNNIDEAITKLIYMWVIENENVPEKIIYIGKTRKTLKNRCDQWKGGFKGASKLGIKTKEKLFKKLNERENIAIYARQSDKIELFEQTISLCETEEIAFIERYKKHFALLNK